jgi:tetratricopeptide (TPR) repeat protein
MGVLRRIESRLSDKDSASGLPRSSDRLDSWKEVANYLRREVRTVQLWEKNEGLPIHRHFHKQLGTIFAFRSEIDAWARQASKGVERSDVANDLAVLPAKTAAAANIFLKVSNLAAPHGQREQQKFCDSVSLHVCTLLRRYLPEHLSVQAESDLAENTIARYYLRWRSPLPWGESLRISLDLCDGGLDIPLWSDSYSFASAESAEAELEIATQIAQCLWLKLVPERSLPVPARGTAMTGSREIYLRGRYFWNQRSVEGMRKAMRCFELAIQDDPSFALAYSGLADCLTLLSFYEIASPHELMPAARSAALKAIELAPDLAEAHASLADVMLHFDRDWIGADFEYRKAIGCNPEYALGYHWYANSLAAHGHHEAALLAISQALQIDPVSQITVVWAGVISHLARKYDKAIGYYQDALELNPGFAWAHMYMAQALEQKGNYAAALREFDTTLTLGGASNSVEAMKAHTYGIAGDRSSALHIVQQIVATPQNRHVPSYDIAAVYAALGNRHETFAWLTRACDERSMKLFSLTQDPRFDCLRDSSGFRSIVRTIGLSNGVSAATRW